MFSFHKPKIYRSNLGCCICKAKSSSSRFTDSKKYENEFERCFRIQEKRSGEICNACVLLVKRWKKLSAENRLIKHWHHVVDARAGPGTKLTGNRRLTNNSSSANNSKTSNNNNDLSSSSLSSSAAAEATSNLISSASGSNQQQIKHHNKQYSNANNRLTDVLPLSSSQASNQATFSSVGMEGSSSSTVTGTPSNSTGSIRRRTGSWSSNKARAIDTNVSTFTFGEPSFRRSYMASEPSYSTPSSSIYKPQSALNSGAFESVIKRFRQRQQQEQIEAKRRQLNRKQRLMQQQQQQQQQPQSQQSFKLATQKTSDATQTAPEKECQNNYEKQQEDLGVSEKALPVLPSKRQKRSSESIGSLSIDGIRVSTILDSSIWRKEKICCGIIFRGLNNEIAVFPKLLKPCQARIANKKLRGDQELDIRDDEDLNTRQIQSPPPRATKSGSISSCDSNTSGTGSMEQPLDDNWKQNLLPFQILHTHTFTYI